MLFFNIILLAVLSLADRIFEEGVLYFVSSVDPQKNITVGIENNRLIGNNQNELVDFYDSGAIMFPEYGKYLTMDNTGLLVLGDEPNLKMNFKDVSGGDDWRKGFFYEDNGAFQLSPDGAISFQSDCDSGRQIQILYEVRYRRPLQLDYFKDMKTSSST